MSREIDTPGKAIAETNSLIGRARSDTRKRKFWGYIQVAALQEWAEVQDFWPTTDEGNKIVPAIDEVLARQFFGTKLDAEVRRGGTPEMFAVWRKLETPDTEPNFNDQDE